MFASVAIMRKYRGVLESPNPLSAALVPLKPKNIRYGDIEQPVALSLQEDLTI